MICKRVYYSGQVQGVGFRWTARRTAGGYRVTGFVRNLSDGRVELLAEGAADQVEAFLNAVAQKMVGNIRDTEVADETPQGLKGFEVRK